MTLHGTESDKFNVPAVGIRLESTRGIKLSPTTDTFPGIGNATGATGIITEFVLRIPLNSKVGSSLKSDGTSRDESPTVDILCRTSRMEREGDKDLWPRRGIL